MTKSTFRSAIVTGALALVLMTPADPFTTGELIGISAGDGDGQAEAVPWYRNTFIKVRAAGTQSVQLPDRAPAKRKVAKVKPALQQEPSEIQPPAQVQNLRRADGL